jgi:hypothetical protein
MIRGKYKAIVSYVRNHENKVIYKIIVRVEGQSP